MYSPYTEEVEKTYRHLYGERKHLNGIPCWSVARDYHEMYPNLSRLYSEIDHGMWKLNQTKRHTMLLYGEYCMFEVDAWKEMIHELLLRGENINVQDDDGNTMLHELIYEMAEVDFAMVTFAEDEHDPDGEYMDRMDTRKDNLCEMIAYLLVNGADPLLAGGEDDYTVLDAAEELLYEPSDKDRVIALLQPYC